MITKSELELEREIISMIDDQMALLIDMRSFLDKESKNHFLYPLMGKRYNFVFNRLQQLQTEHETLVGLNQEKVEVKEEEKKEDGTESK